MMNIINTTEKEMKSEHRESLYKIENLQEIIRPPPDVILKLLNIITALKKPQPDVDMSSKLSKMFIVTPKLSNDISVSVDLKNINLLLRLSLQSKDGKAKNGGYRICVVYLNPPIFQIISEEENSNPIYVITTDPLPDNLKCPSQYLLSLENYRLKCNTKPARTNPKNLVKRKSTDELNTSESNLLNSENQLATPQDNLTKRIAKDPNDAMQSFENLVEIVDISKDLKERQRIAIKKYEEKIISKHTEFIKAREKYYKIRDEIIEKKGTSPQEIDMNIMSSILSRRLDTDSCNFMLLQVRSAIQKKVMWTDEDKLWALQLLKKYPLIYNFLKDPYILPSKKVLRAFVNYIENEERENTLA